MKKLVLAVLVLVSIGTFAHAQEYVSGTVWAEEDGQRVPLMGANVYWSGTTQGTTTGADGSFKLRGQGTFVVSFIGYANDTLPAVQKTYEILLRPDSQLEEVEVVHERKGVEIDYLSPLKSENVGERELLKAACCNLSESFDTNPSVDVSFTDAVTGTRQIQMLGLSGPYTQITRENMPDIRGLSAIYGLTYIPGTWIESIQINKGAGTVTNGFESIAGQINTELRKTDGGDKLYANLYTNEGGRVEANLNFRNEVNERWSTASLLHVKNNSFKMDRNDDGFLDNPLGTNVIALNRWRLIHENGIRMQLGIKGTYIDSQGGQEAFDPDTDKGTTNAWGMLSQTRRLEGWMKLGKVYYDQPWKSVGFQMSGMYHDQEADFGLKSYDGQQSSFYANLIYHDKIITTEHKIKTGVSLQYDRYSEQLNTMDFDRNEFVPGVFAEYSYDHLDKFNMLAGIRVDHHNNYGLFVTPRLHMRYAIADGTVLRASAGRGQRTASIFAENVGVMASSREIIVRSENKDTPYGLDAEVAWNYGVNLTQEFTIDYRIGTISFDYYRTDFQNQIVLDLDQSPQQAVFYNLSGRSFSNSFQAQLDYEVIQRLDMRIGYRWFDVQTTYGDELREKPFVSEQRVFLNLGYATRNKWKFDYTINWQGQKRIPFTESNPEEYQLDQESPDFVVMNAQVSKAWLSGFEVYVGVENMLNYRQEDPILSSDNPFSDYFDSSMVWGPVFGRNTYLGLRYRLK